MGRKKKKLHGIPRFLLAAGGLGWVFALFSQPTEIRIPVRVLRNGAFVQGLLKDDFQVSIAEKSCLPRELNPVLIRLAVDPGHPPVAPRLFVLNFQNLTRYQKLGEEDLGNFLSQFIAKHDRVAIMTNHFYFPPRIVIDRETEFKEIREIYEAESEWLQWELRQFKMKLGQIQRMRGEDVYSAEGRLLPIEGANDRMRSSIIDVLRSYHSIFGKISADRIRILEKTLAAFQGEKHLISIIGRKLSPRVRESSGLTIEDIRQIDGLAMEESFGAIQLHGAVSHTCLLPSIQEDSISSPMFEWKAFVSQSERAFLEASRQSLGVISETETIADFRERLASLGVEGYELVCPWEGEPPAPDSIRIEIMGGGLEVQTGGMAPSSPTLRLESPEFISGQFSVTFKDYSRSENQDGRVRVEFRLLDSQWHMQMSSQKEFHFSGVDDRIQIPLTKLRKGQYRIFISATDLLNQTQAALLFMIRI